MVRRREFLRGSVGAAGALLFVGILLPPGQATRVMSIPA